MVDLAGRASAAGDGAADRSGVALGAVAAEAVDLPFGFRGFRGVEGEVGAGATNSPEKSSSPSGVSLSWPVRTTKSSSERPRLRRLLR